RSALCSVSDPGWPRNIVKPSTGLSGLTALARATRPCWHSTTSASSGIWFTGACCTFPEYGASADDSWPASMTLLPIPASHATMTFLIVEASKVLICVPSFSSALVVDRSAGRDLFLQFPSLLRAAEAQQ